MHTSNELDVAEGIRAHMNKGERRMSLTFQFPAMMGCRSFNWVTVLPLVLMAVKALAPEMAVASNVKESFILGDDKFCYFDPTDSHK